MAADRQRLLRAAHRLLASPSDAEDVVQDSYVRALTAFPGGLEVHPAWMHTVLRNIAIDRLRRRRLESNYFESELPDEESSDSVSGIELESECRAALCHLLARVSATEAAAILLRDIFDFDHVELARLIGRNVDATRQFLARARARIRRPDASAEVEECHVVMCWRAIEARDPAMLMEMLRTTTAAGMPLTAVRAGEHRAARSSSVLVQVNGRYALALVLGGVVLCVVPVGAHETVS
jgi:RNA polymerase sigma factor (sigma-70 family)